MTRPGADPLAEVRARRVRVAGDLRAARAQARAGAERSGSAVTARARGTVEAVRRRAGDRRGDRELVGMLELDRPEADTGPLVLPGPVSVTDDDLDDRSWLRR